MKRIFSVSIMIYSFILVSCNSGTEQNETTNSADESAVTSTGQSGIQDDMSQKNVVQVAISSQWCPKRFRNL